MQPKPTYEELEKRVRELEGRVRVCHGAEERLLESEKRYKLIFDQSPLGIIHFDQEGTIVDCNNKLLEIMGAKRKAVVGFNMLRVLKDEHMRRVLIRALSGEIGRYEGDYLSLSGNKLTTLRAIYSCITSEDGKFLGAAGLFEDISEQKKAERALRESEERYRTLVETMSDGLLVRDERNTIAYVNPRLCHMWEYKREEIIGRPLVNFLDEANRLVLDEQLILRRKGVMDHYELTWTAKSGRKVPTIMSPKPIFDSSGSFKGSFVVITDITRRKEAEDALRKARDTLEIRVRERTAELAGINEALRGEILERNRAEMALRSSEERYRGIVEDQTELIFRIDPDMKLTFVNRAFCRFFGKNDHELTGELLADCVGSQEVAHIREKLLSLSAEEPVGKSDQRVSNGQGEPRWVQWTTRVIHDSLRNHMEYQWVGRDITEAKNMQEALQESARIIKFFAYSIVHDLKSPSVALYGLVRLLQRNYGHMLDERAAAYCDQILKASEQISALVESINLYISTRECRLMVEEINLSHLLEMIRSEFSERMQERGVLWATPEGPPLIRGDRLALIRVFRNLVDNALKYGGNELKAIKISYRSEGDHHVLSVTDDGVGVNQEDSGRIFELFQRCRKTGGSSVEGAGLGLNIVREIAEKHGGRVWVERCQAGTSFNVSVSKML